VIDVSDPSNPSHSRSLGIGDEPTSVAVSGNYAYVVDIDSEDLKVIDLLCYPTSAINIGPDGNFIEVPLNWEKSGDNIYSTNTGNLGIGTNTPDNDLTVYSEEDYGGITLKTSDNDFSQGVRFQNSGDSYTWNIYRKDAGSSDADLVFASGKDPDISSLTDRIIFKKSGKVGIGTTNPEGQLHINNAGDATFILQADDDNNGENDNPRIELRQDGDDVVGALGFIGESGEIYANSNSNALYLMNENPRSLHLGTDNTIFATLKNSGNFGIGTTDPTATLSVNGDANKPGGGSWGTFSDERSQENIVNYNKGLEEILAFRPVSYNYKEEFGWGTASYVGLIAQEVQKVAPSMVSEIEVNGINDFRQLDVNELSYMSINAIKELKQNNDALLELINAQSELINNQTEQINLLKQRIEKLER